MGTGPRMPRIGETVAVRAEGGGFWLARVEGFNGETEVVCNNCIIMLCHISLCQCTSAAVSPHIS